jgi:hypothetical protein
VPAMVVRGGGCVSNRRFFSDDAEPSTLPAVGVSGRAVESREGEATSPDRESGAGERRPEAAATTRERATRG